MVGSEGGGGDAEADADSYSQLQKLSKAREEEVELLLLSLWKSRKTGLSAPDKSKFQSLLRLPSLSQLDPVLSCLRSLMRKFVHHNLNADDLLKLFPPDLPIHLQSLLLLLFQKHQPHWKADFLVASTSTTGPHQHPSLSLGTCSPWHSHSHSHLNNKYSCNSSSSSFFTASNISLQQPQPQPHLQAILPRLKSMTWSMDKGKSLPSNKVAVIITLKLQDYTISTSGDLEVKFRLTRDTLEAMLRSMTYISQQLSTIVGSSSVPVQKKQRQSDHIL